MPRKNRVWYPGAIYHIMGRGIRRTDIFKDEEDRLVYLAKLLEAKETYDFNLYSYCLMTNHIHLQIQTKEISISAIMKLINTNYAIYFNRKYNFVGHLFQCSVGPSRTSQMGTVPPSVKVLKRLN